MPAGPVSAGFRGQNILGYNHYADDVVEYFVQKSIANGIDIIRIFDCFNDLRNLQTAVKAANKERGHAQIALSYTLGDAYTLEYWTNMAKQIEEMGADSICIKDIFLKPARSLRSLSHGSSLRKRRDASKVAPPQHSTAWTNMAKQIEEMGADSICIKDMAGLLVPYEATKLVKALKAGTKLPIEMHTHYTSGVASMTYLKSVEAGADIIDTAMSPFAMGTSQPATEGMVERSGRTA